MEFYKDHQTSQNSKLSPLWPHPIPIIGVTGEPSSGKTLLAATIDPHHALVYDTEQSSASYSSLGFERVDVLREMLRVHHKGYRPIQTFEWWLEHVRNILPNKYRILVLDTVSEIENGLVEYVRSHPQTFGHTAGQYTKMSGLMWGDVKDFWKTILSDIAARCETFVFTSHMTTVWKGERPTGERKPKGKDTLMELASLYLRLERKPDKQGNVPDKPAAMVLKSRLAHTRINPETGALEVIPSLPPRLPVATPEAIRQYMQTPPDYSRLKDDERAREQSLTEDEKIQLRLATAEAERDAEAYRLEQLLTSGQQQAPQVNPVAAQRSPIPGPHLTDHQALELKDLRAELRIDGEQWQKILGRYGVTTGRELTPAQATDLAATLRDKLRELLVDGMPTHNHSPLKGGEPAESTAAVKS